MFVEITKVVSIVLIFLTLNSEGVSIYCELKWSSEGYGNIPSFAIESGSKEYVGRAYHVNKWIPGRISPSKGKIFITSGSQPFEYDTYEVLTNPNNCLLQWVDGHGGSYPEDAVSVSSRIDPEVLIGRGEIAGLILGGQVIIAESAIFISYDGREEIRRSYQLLRSFYPPLKVKLSKFVFMVPGKLPNITELIGQEEIRNSFNAEILQSIDHGKTVQERFTLTEDHSWEGIEQVTLSFSLWYGSSDVSGEFQVNPDAPEDAELIIERNREIRIKRDITVKGASGSSAGHIQVCSTVSIVADLTAGISFKASATYEADNMTADQVKHILSESGRRITAAKAHKRNSVTGEFSGELNGRFAIHSSSYTNVVDGRCVCCGYATSIPS